MENVNEFADCRFYGGVGRCRALRDTYCLSDGECSFYKPKSAEDETEAMPKNRYNGISEDKIAQIRELYKSGMKQMDIAKAVGASQGTVAKYVRGV